MVWALGIAAAEPVGLREMFGTMTKSFHAGRAAHNGLTAAFLASKNFNSSDHGIEGALRLGHDAERGAELRRDHGKSRPELPGFAQYIQAVRLRDPNSAHDPTPSCIQLRRQYQLDGRSDPTHRFESAPARDRVDGQKDPADR